MTQWHRLENDLSTWNRELQLNSCMWTIQLFIHFLEKTWFKSPHKSDPIHAPVQEVEHALSRLWRTWPTVEDSLTSRNTHWATMRPNVFYFLLVLGGDRREDAVDPDVSPSCFSGELSTNFYLQWGEGVKLFQSTQHVWGTQWDTEAKWSGCSGIK